MYRIAVADLAKRFGSRWLFQDLSFDLTTGDSLAITGPNGSGKSTLLQILLGLIRPSGGAITYLSDETSLEQRQCHQLTGFVAPYLFLYDQLTGEENLKFFSSVAGRSVTGKGINAALELVGLGGRGEDPVGHYSSGMKQRLKYAVAVISEPAFLVLDEPFANLDDAGRGFVMELVSRTRQRTILVLATNEKGEADLAGHRIQLG